MKKSLLLLSIFVAVLTVLVTFCPKCGSGGQSHSSISFSPKTNRFLLQPTLGSPGALYVLQPAEVQESYLKVVVDVKTLPVRSAQEASESLEFRLISAEQESSTLFVSTFLPPVLNEGHFTAYLGSGREEPLPAGVYTLELWLNKFNGKKERLDRQPNAVWIEEINQSGHYSFLVIQGTQFNAQGSESPIFRNFVKFLEQPSLDRSNFLPSHSIVSRQVLYGKTPPLVREENFNKTLDRLKNVKFVVLVGDMLRSPQEVASCSFSKDQASVYERNYQAFYKALIEAKKPFFLIPGNRDAQVLLHPNGTVAFDGLQFFETYFGPLRSSFSYRKHHYALFNTYEHSAETRTHKPGQFVPSGGFVSESLLKWLDTIPSPDFVFAPHDPRGGGYSTAGLSYLNLGNLQDWDLSEKNASWMKPTPGDQRLKLLEYLANLTQAQLFFASSALYFQEKFEGGENLLGWKDFNEWRDFNLGLRYVDDFLIGTLLFECYHLLPSLLIQDRLSHLDQTVSPPSFSLLSVSLEQIRLGCPTLKGINSSQLTQFMSQLEKRIQNMGISQLRELAGNFEKSVSYFKQKPEFVSLLEQINHYRTILEENKKINPRFLGGIDRWKESMSRFFLEGIEQEEYLKVKEIRIREKTEQKNQRNFLSLSQVPSFIAKEHSGNDVLLVTVQDMNNLDIQPLRFYFERSMGCYLLLFLLIALELFCFQWTRSFWEGMASAFLETGEDFFGCPHAKK